MISFKYYEFFVFIHNVINGGIKRNQFIREQVADHSTLTLLMNHDVNRNLFIISHGINDVTLIIIQNTRNYLI